MIAFVYLRMSQCSVVCVYRLPVLLSDNRPRFQKHSRKQNADLIFVSSCIDVYILCPQNWSDVYYLKIQVIGKSALSTSSLIRSILLQHYSVQTVYKIVHIVMDNNEIEMANRA